MSLSGMFENLKKSVPEGWEQAVGFVPCPKCDEVSSESWYNNETGKLQVTCACGGGDIFIGAGRSDGLE